MKYASVSTWQLVSRALSAPPPISSLLKFAGMHLNSNASASLHFAPMYLVCDKNFGHNCPFKRSDVNKPNGVTVVAPTFDDSARFIQSMPTRRVPGIGRVLEKILRDALGCSSMMDVFHKRSEIHALFSPASSSFLITRSVGCGDTAHSLPALPGTAGGRKSYSQESASMLAPCAPRHCETPRGRYTGRLQRRQGAPSAGRASV